MSEPRKSAVGCRDAGAEASLQQITAGWRLPVQHLPSGENTGAMQHHQPVVEEFGADTAGGGNRACDRGGGCQADWQGLNQLG